jgi:uncharacterized protein (DUF2236 family)
MIDDSAGLYGPDSEAWRLNREAMLVLGAGPRALLLQVAHPLVAEGVEQHSDFRADPWRRLQGTLRGYLSIVYGRAPRARAEIRRLNALHRDIGGPVRDAGARRRHGARYRARDPELSLWVHATLVDSTIVANDRWLGPLPRNRQAAFYAETRPIGRAFGIPDSLLPADLGAFERYVADMLDPHGPVHPTPAARDIAAAVLAPPLGPIAPTFGWIPARAYAWTLWPSVGLLPASVRAEYGLPWGVRERAVSAWLVAAWRAWRPILPPDFRQLPQATTADRRVAGAHRAAWSPAHRVRFDPGPETTIPRWRAPAPCRSPVQQRRR